MPSFCHCQISSPALWHGHLNTFNILISDIAHIFQSSSYNLFPDFRRQLTDSINEDRKAAEEPFEDEVAESETEFKETEEAETEETAE